MVNGNVGLYGPADVWDNVTLSISESRTTAIAEWNSRAIEELEEKIERN